jgi:LuxR family maltose regulon positive regulatory protein
VALAKLTRPKLHQVLPRERLFARLEACRERPLVWVVGPPGAGKTALVASWLNAHRIGGVWYQVDPGDRDLATFFHYLGRAAPAPRKRDAPLPAFTAEHAADPAGFARLYFRALFERMKPPAAIVFDNYHELPAGAPLHAMLEAIAREVPERLFVIATSRGEPPPECAALRASQSVAMLDWDELRLTFDETCGIAALRQHLDETTLRNVHAQADGWPVGLVLTLEQVQRGGTDAAVPETQGREVLFAYFAAQIVGALPEPVRAQLLRIALLPRATPAQAAMIAGDAHAGALLDQLYRKRLFVERRGEAYQFHDLFRAYLVQELERTLETEALAQVRRDAIELLLQSEQYEAAFDCAERAQDWPAAASIVLRFAPKLFEYGRLATLRSWCEALPAPLLAASPWLGLWKGVALSASVPLQARAIFESAYAGFGDADLLGRVFSAAGILATHYLEFDHGQVDQWIDVLTAHLAEQPAFPAPAAELRVHAALFFALSFQRPRADLVASCLARIRTLVLAPDMPVNPRVDAATLMLANAQVVADFDEVERIAAMVAPWLADPGLTPNHLAMWTLQYAHALNKMGRDAEALQAYDVARKVADDNALVLPPLRVYGHLGRATVALCMGDPDQAERERALGASYWNYGRKLDRAIDASLRGSIAAHRGEREEAIACMQAMVEQMDEVGPVWLRIGARLQHALALFDADQDADVAPILDQARAMLAGTCLVRHAPAMDTVEAWIRLRREGLEAARPWIERCVAGRDTHHGQCLLRMHPRVLPEVYAAALALRIADGDVRRAIRDYHLRAPEADPPGWPWPFEVRMLGRFEVLRDGQPLAFSRKVPKKTLALLKAVVALGGRSVSEQRLIDALWPDEEGDAAARALDATVLRLRTLLGDPQAIVQRGGRVAIDSERVWVDVFAFEQALASNEHADGATLQRALDLYGGAFLAEDEGESWPVAARERLRGRFIHALARQAEAFEAAGEDDRAIAAYLRGIDADPAIESFYQGLMRCYDHLGRRGEAIAAYQRMRQILSITLGLQPSAGSERMYQQLRQ